MAHLFPSQKQPFACGAVGNYIEIASTKQFSSPDLDTRPAEMARLTVGYWVPRSESCGCAAPDVSPGSRKAARLTKTPTTAACRQVDRCPKLAREFLCCALIQEGSGKEADAFWSAVDAAWACDDAEPRDVAVARRARATRLFERAREQGVSIADDNGRRLAILADLSRRSGRFDELASRCQGPMAAGQEDILESIRRIQLALGKRKDVACHTIDEAVTSSQTE
jgi:hypothetical protein